METKTLILLQDAPAVLVVGVKPVPDLVLGVSELFKPFDPLLFLQSLGLLSCTRRSLVHPSGPFDNPGVDRRGHPGGPVGVVKQQRPPVGPRNADLDPVELEVLVERFLLSGLPLAAALGPVSSQDGVDREAAPVARGLAQCGRRCRHSRRGLRGRGQSGRGRTGGVIVVYVGVGRGDGDNGDAVGGGADVAHVLVDVHVGLGKRRFAVLA